MAPSNTRSERIASRNGVSRRVGLIRLCYRARCGMRDMGNSTIRLRGLRLSHVRCRPANGCGSCSPQELLDVRAGPFVSFPRGTTMKEPTRPPGTPPGVRPRFAMLAGHCLGYASATSDDAQLHAGRADLARARIWATATRRRRRDHPPVPPRLAAHGPDPAEPRPYTLARPEPGRHRSEMARARQGRSRAEGSPARTTNEGTFS